MDCRVKPGNDSARERAKARPLTLRQIAQQARRHRRASTASGPNSRSAWIDRADALDLSLARLDPGFDGRLAGFHRFPPSPPSAGARRRRWNRARGRARDDRNSRTQRCSRAAVTDAVETEKRLGGEVRRDDRGDRLPGAVGDQHQVGRGGDLRNARRCGAASVSGTPASASSFAARARVAAASFGSAASSAAVNRRDALAVMLDHARQPLRQIGVAQEPDQPVEQQVLHGGVERELHLARQPCCRAR